MSSNGWLSREDFEELDRLFSLLGFGGYYDFLEMLKIIGDRIGVQTIFKKGVVLREIKTIPDMLELLTAWSSFISKWRIKNSVWTAQVLLENMKEA